MMGNMSYHPNPGSLPEERYGHTDALVEAAAQRARLQDDPNTPNLSLIHI